jgi:hypothetical protein
VSSVPSLFLVPKWENSHNIDGRATSGVIVVLHVACVASRCVAYMYSVYLHVLSVHSAPCRPDMVGCSGLPTTRSVPCMHGGIITVHVLIFRGGAAAM